MGTDRRNFRDSVLLIHKSLLVFQDLVFALLALFFMVVVIVDVIVLTFKLELKQVFKAFLTILIAKALVTSTRILGLSQDSFSLILFCHVGIHLNLLNLCFELANLLILLHDYLVFVFDGSLESCNLNILQLDFLLMTDSISLVLCRLVLESLKLSLIVFHILLDLEIMQLFLSFLLSYLLRGLLLRLHLLLGHGPLDFLSHELANLGLHGIFIALELFDHGALGLVLLLFVLHLLLVPLLLHVELDA